MKSKKIEKLLQSKPKILSIKKNENFSLKINQKPNDILIRVPVKKKIFQIYNFLYLQIQLPIFQDDLLNKNIDIDFTKNKVQIQQPNNKFLEEEEIDIQDYIEHIPIQKEPVHTFVQNEFLNNESLLEENKQSQQFSPRKLKLSEQQNTQTSRQEQQNALIQQDKKEEEDQNPLNFQVQEEKTNEFLIDALAAELTRLDTYADNLEQNLHQNQQLVDQFAKQNKEIKRNIKKMVEDQQQINKIKKLEEDLHLDQAIKLHFYDDMNQNQFNQQLDQLYEDNERLYKMNDQVLFEFEELYGSQLAPPKKKEELDFSISLDQSVVSPAPIQTRNRKLRKLQTQILDQSPQKQEAQQNVYFSPVRSAKKTHTMISK